MKNKKDLEFDFTWEIPQSLYGALLRSMREAFFEYKVNRLNSMSFSDSLYGPIKAEFEKDKNPILYVENDLGRYKLKAIPDETLCDTRIEKVKETRQVEVEISKEIFTYKKGK